ncbi:DUF1272 domain-containing protein [Dyella sp. C9]|uniref:DUF1272 domain-containing protein n=1 Tax=Dyella sp. C9 TaxID=2202154 RepID=UPI000DEEE899|nr:DUF1272 domain-containing protein [Dyella sp. C9]
MLELRPTCEHCNRSLPPDSTEAMICTFECTFCRDCVALLHDVCPNCAGGFAPRPIRPAQDWGLGRMLGQHPPTPHAVHRPVDLARHAALVARVGIRPPEQR